MNTQATKSITKKGIHLNTKEKSMSEPINSEQVRVIKKLEEVLNLLRNLTIKNEESLTALDKPLDDILSNLKYLPTDPSFDILPTEIKTDIFSYLCDSRAFVAASVCQEWKSIIERRLMKIEELTIGKHCSNEYDEDYDECEGNECFMPEEVLKASIFLKLDIPLTICHPLRDVDSNIIVEALSSVSSLRIEGECSWCTVESLDEDDEENQPIMRKREFKKLFKALNDRSEMMNSLELGGLDLRSLNQKKLVKCLLNKTYSLTLNGGDFPDNNKLIKLDTLVKGLLEVSQDSKLKELSLHNLTDEDLDDEDYADAVCKVYSVHLDGSYLDLDMIDRLIDNILNRPITLKKITISEEFDWDTLIEPDDLKTLIEKMSGVDLIGVFSPEQVETIRFLPGVQASVDKISKGELDWRK